MHTLKNLIDTALVGRAVEELRQFPAECIDITVTSPPYNKKRRTYGWLVQNNGYSHFNDSMKEGEYQSWQIETLNELHRITKSGGSVFYNHKVRWVKGKMLHPYDWISRSLWDIRQEIIWDRTLAANVRGWRFWQVEEHIYWLYKPIGSHLVGEELESRHAKMGSIWQLKPVPRNPNHPAPFPLELPVRAIYSIPGNEKKVVLDPFCGTGTTLVAAKLLGHHYIGIDISPDYIEFTRSRLEDYENERQVAQEEMDLHVVKDSFEDRKERGTISWPYGPDNEDD
jgi:modification methylase